MARPPITRDQLISELRERARHCAPEHRAFYEAEAKRAEAGEQVMRPSHWVYPTYARTDFATK